MSTFVPKPLICFGLLAALAVPAVSCGGGGAKGSPTESITPTGPTNSGTPTPTGDPSNLDYITLGAQIVSMAAGEIVQGLSSGTTATGMTVAGSMDLRRPTQNVTQTAGFFCCGASSRDFITMTTVISVPGSAGALGILQTLGHLTEPEWSSTVANGWNVDLSKLRVTSDLETNGTSVNQAQQLRLSGTFSYRMPNASTKEVNVDVVFRYSNLESSVPTANGRIGNANLTGEPTPSLIQPARCSKPREGCGPTVSGDHPCTVWPKCPGL
jgi:hypothetical protein